MAGEDPLFLGSCAAVGLPTFFVTAGHCVTGHEVTTLAVKHFGNTTRPLSAVVRHAILEECDIAVMEVEVEDTSRIAPYEKIRVGMREGQRVTAIGSPASAFTTHREPKLRVIRGVSQRSFNFEFPMRPLRYAAFELSFTSPRGFSGAPLFADEEPLFLRGIVTANFPGRGVAAEASQAVSFLEEFIHINLKAAGD